MVEDEILFGAFYFLGNTRGEHTRIVFNVMDIFAELGGFYAFFYGILMAIGSYINT
jgi:hypothetical protein